MNIRRSVPARFVRRIATVAAALTLAGGVVMATAGSAEAAAPAGCAAGNFCFWNNANFNDGPGTVTGDNPNYTLFPHASCPFKTWNDCISSLYNNGVSGLSVAVFLDANEGGPSSLCIPDNTGYAFLPQFWPGTTIVLNDSISSNIWTSAC